jgi:protein-S-isoprenylcysteine O-methyltransferase Ste14
VLRGSRGEGWVAAQVALLLLLLVGSFVDPTFPASLRRPAGWVGIVGLIAGTPLLVAGGTSLGRNLTPLPRPKADAALVQTGAYRLVRHPIYGGAILGGLGWALLRGRWLGVLAAVALAVFFDAKASREERWLVERFSDYPAYRRRVPKLIPGLY